MPVSRTDPFTNLMPLKLPKSSRGCSFTPALAVSRKFSMMTCGLIFSWMYCQIRGIGYIVLHLRQCQRPRSNDDCSLSHGFRSISSLTGRQKRPSALLSGQARPGRPRARHRKSPLVRAHHLKLSGRKAPALCRRKLRARHAIPPGHS